MVTRCLLHSWKLSGWQLLLSLIKFSSSWAGHSYPSPRFACTLLRVSCYRPNRLARGLGPFTRPGVWMWSRVRQGSSLQARALCSGQLVGSRCDPELPGRSLHDAHELAESRGLVLLPLPCVRGPDSPEWEPHEAEQAAGLF